MKLIKNASSWVRLAVLMLFGYLAAGIAAGFVVWSVLGAQEDEARSKSALEVAWRAKEASATANLAAEREVREWANTLLRGTDPEALVKYSKAYQDAGKDVEANLSELKAIDPADTPLAKAADQALADHGAMVSAYAKAIARYSAADPLSAQSVDLEVRGVDQPLVAGLGKLSTMLREREVRALNQLSVDAQAARRLVFIGVGAILIVLLLAGTGVTLVFFHSTSKPIHRAMRLARSIADGNLTNNIKRGAQDDAGQMMNALAQMQSSLSDMTSRIRKSAGTINQAAARIADDAQDLSQRTEEQASSLEETSATMEEFSATVRNNASTAREASQIAQAVAAQADQGGNAVSQVVTTMGEIHESSKRIVDIVAVIDAIAFQTNILALNAAVEAARAGEEGRGFAVVATEVRALAQKSATAAKEIKQLIVDSAARVESGSALVVSAGRTIQDVVEAVSQLNELMATIASAAREQSVGIGHVTQTITQMEQATQHNATLVDHATRATESLKQEAYALMEAISRMKTSEAGLADGQLTSPSDDQLARPRMPAVAVVHSKARLPTRF